MREIPNRLFSEAKGTFDSPIILPRGLVVARTFTTRSYFNNMGKEEHAVLPEVIVCQGNKKAPVKINGSGIIALSPAPCYSLQFNPSFMIEYLNGGEIIYKFEGAFIPEGMSGKGNISVRKFNLTDLYDKCATPGEIKHTGIDSRDITLRGPMNELEMMLNLAFDSLPKKLYDLTNDIPIGDKANKYYSIIISNDEMARFSKSVAGKIF